MFTVLFVDDNRRLREFWKQELERDGYRVLPAADGAEAVEMLGRETPDLVVLDLHMPRMNGAAAARRMQKEFPGLYVIFYSDEKPEPKTRALAQGWVRKSDEPGELKAAVAQILAAHFEDRLADGNAEV